MDPSIIAALKGIGLEDKEARVYLALVESGTASVSDIARRAELKRPIVYYVLERLHKRGYAHSVQVGKVRHFAASDPTRVLRDSQAAAEELRFMLPLILALQDKGTAKPRIEYLEGKEAILSVYRYYNTRTDARFLTSIQRLNEFIPEETETWLRNYESGKTKKKTKATLLTDTPADRAWAKRAIKAGQSVRTVPHGMSIDMDFSIVDNILSITSFDPLFIVVIHSERVAKSAGQLFDLAWESGREIV